MCHRFFAGRRRQENEGLFILRRTMATQRLSACQRSGAVGFSVNPRMMETREKPNTLC